MPQCKYVGPSGNQCTEDTTNENGVCYWHDRNTPKSDEWVKERLEQKSKNRESMEGYQLARADLEDAYLLEADLSHADLSRVNLKDGHLWSVNLKGAQLFKVNLEHANLKEANLEGADFLGANLDDTDLERANWGESKKVRNHIDAVRLAGVGDTTGAKAKYLEAEEIYRNIRQRYEAAGTSDIAGDFFHLEMVSKRKQMPIFSMNRMWSALVDILCGYGEIPYRVISSSIIFIVLNALIFCFLGMSHGDRIYRFSASITAWDNLLVFGNSLYYSVVTFTTLGYGDFSPVRWARPFAAIEGFCGAFMIALFVVSFTKKMSR